MKKSSRDHSSVLHSLGSLACHVRGKVIGDAKLEISGAAPISIAGPDEITFLAERRTIDELQQSRAGAVITHSSIDDCEIPCIVVDDVEQAFIEIVSIFQPPVVRRRQGIRPGATISDTAQLESDVEVYPGAFVGDQTRIGSGTTIHANVTVMENCCIGQNVTIFPGAVLYDNTVVGDGSIIHGGVTLGANGFGYDSDDGRHRLSAQLGNVVIENDVEIGSNTTIDRGTYGSTTIGEGTKIDDQVMIGHNCRIGRHNLLCSQVGIAGSTTTGDYVVMAGQVGVGDHLKIGDRVTLGAKAGVMHDLEAGGTYLGAPAIPVREKMLLVALTSKLPEMKKQIKNLKAEIAELRPPGRATRHAA